MVAIRKTKKKTKEETVERGDYITAINNMLDKIFDINKIIRIYRIVLHIYRND